MWLPAKDELTPAEVEKGLRTVIKDGLTSQAMGMLVGGAFLVDFALRLGASNFVIGMIAAITPLAQLIQMPSVYLVEKVQNRRAITVLGCTVSRMSLFAIAAIPFLLLVPNPLWILMAALMVYAGFSAIATCSWNSWMRDLIPQDRLGTFFAKRMALATALGIGVSLAAGFFVDYWKSAHPGRELYGYSILFAAGALAGMLGVYLISRIPEPKMEPAGERLQFLQLIKRPLKDANFRNLLWFLGPWNFAVNLATPFFMVYMLKTLKLPLSLVIGMSVLNQVVTFGFLGIWGRYSDRFSNKSVLTVNGILLLLTIFGWTFTGDAVYYPVLVGLLALLHIAMGIANSGVTLAAGNIGLKLAPKGAGTTYLATITIVNSLASGIAPLLGGKFADFFASRELAWTLTWNSPKTHFAIHTLHLQHWDFFFFLAFVIGLYSIHRLALVRETGDVNENVILRELMSEMKQTSLRVFKSLSGLQIIFQFPFVLARYLETGRSRKQPESKTIPTERTKP